MNLKRIDIFLVEKGYVKTRTLAQEFIKNGWILVDQKIIDKPSFQIDLDEEHFIEILAMNKYVSRAGDKLHYANEHLKIDFKDKVVLDIGASTGGFSDYALQHGAKKVYCLDVGKNQLDNKLRIDPRIINLEETNLKDIPTLHFDSKIDIILCDVSFISLEHVFKAIDHLVKEDDPQLVFLIKPQFETKGMVLKNFKGKVKENDLDKVLNKVKQTALMKGYQLMECIPSEVKGKKLENQEFFGIFKKWQ